MHVYVWIRMRMNTSHLFKKLCPLGHSTVCFKYVHAGVFLSTKHGPEGGRGDDNHREQPFHFDALLGKSRCVFTFLGHNDWPRYKREQSRFKTINLFGSLESCTSFYATSQTQSIFKTIDQCGSFAYAQRIKHHSWMGSRRCKRPTTITAAIQHIS